MNSKFRNAWQVALASAALVAGPLAWADGGVTGKLAGKVREQASREANASRNEQPRNEQPRNEQPRNEQPRTAQPRTEQRPESRPAQRPEPRSGNRPEPRPDARGTPRPAQRLEPTPAQPSSQPAPVPRQNNARGNERSPDRGVTGTLIQREYQTDRDQGNGSGRGDRNDRDRGNNGRDWDRDSSGHRDRDWDRDRRPGRVVHRLPGGYRDYVWNGSRYYYYSGYWYRPYGSSFISIGVPYGLFVTTLPGAYTSVWVGGTRYFYSDYSYYVYEPVRRGYVVAPSPYGDDVSDYEDSRLDEDLYIYPASGQSEQQQADDRYQCHRWAVDQTGYDPIDDEYDANLRKDYLRAMTACLTGRGYTVR